MATLLTHFWDPSWNYTLHWNNKKKRNFKAVFLAWYQPPEVFLSVRCFRPASFYWFLWSFLTNNHWVEIKSWLTTVFSPSHMLWGISMARCPKSSSLNEVSSSSCRLYKVTTIVSIFLGREGNNPTERTSSRPSLHLQWQRAQLGGKNSKNTEVLERSLNKCLFFKPHTQAWKILFFLQESCISAPAEEHALTTLSLLCWALRLVFEVRLMEISGTT